MENIQEIFCDCCSEVAYEYDLNIISGSQLEGKECVCKSCAAIGRIVYDGEIWFRTLDDYEIPCVDFSTLVEGYEESQRKISEMASEIANLRSLLRQSTSVGSKG